MDNKHTKGKKKNKET